MKHNLPKDRRILNLFDVLGIDYILKSGPEKVAQRHCLFHHEKTPSMAIYSQLIRCYGCHTSYILNPNLSEELELPVLPNLRISFFNHSKFMEHSGLFLENFVSEWNGMHLDDARKLVYDSFNNPWAGENKTSQLDLFPKLRKEQLNSLKSTNYADQYYRALLLNFEIEDIPF